jgi:RNA polymerase-associated protein CTR9
MRNRMLLKNSYSLLRKGFEERNRETVEIPIKGTDEVIEVTLDEIPEAEEILSILRDEEPGFDIWYVFALEYYRKGSYEGFEKIIQELLQRLLPSVNKRNGDRKDKEVKELEKLCINVLNSQTAYYLNQIQEEKDNNKKNILFGKVIWNLNEADKIDPHQKNLWIMKGYNYFIRQEYDTAMSHFNAVIQRVIDHPLATLGLGLISFKKKEYETSILFFSRCLKSLPILPIFVRYAMGVCYMELKQFSKAKLTFERGLDLNPMDIHCKIALGLLMMRIEEDSTSILKSMNLFKQVYEVDSKNSIVLNHLAHHFIIKGDYEKAKLLATNAFHGTYHPLIRGESTYHLARLLHIQGQYEQALQQYFMATQLHPNFTLPYYGLAQLYIWKGQLLEAIKPLEKILESIPNNYECIRMLSSLYYKSQSHMDKTLIYLKKSIELNPYEPFVYLELAHTYEGIDDLEASKAYDQVISLFKRKNLSISPEMWNNFGTFKFRIQDYSTSQIAFEKSLDLINLSLEDNQLSPSKSLEYKMMKLTTLYNLGRIYEHLYDSFKAEEAYKHILNEYPKYIDAYLRLGCISKMRGHLSEAYDWFKEGLIDGEQRPEVWCLMGDIHILKNEYKLAMKKYERNVKLENRTQTDLYSFLSLANAYLQYSRHSQDKEIQSKAKKKATELYQHALKSDPHNIYAAHGLSILLVEKGYLKEALEIFLKVRESTSEFPDASIHIGHVQLEMGQFMSSIRTYETCSKKYFGHRNVFLLIYIARACYLLGKKDKNSSILLKAISYLERSIKIRPQEDAIWFNLALCQQELASIVLHQEQTERTLHDVLRAQDHIVSSLK